MEPPDRPNMGLWQLTADLPFSMDLAFLGGQADVGAQRFPWMILNTTPPSLV